MNQHMAEILAEDEALHDHSSDLLYALTGRRYDNSRFSAEEI